MTEKELNSYRLTSLEEPTDEMLETIMREAAEDVRRSNKEVERRLLEQLDAQVEANKRQYKL